MARVTQNRADPDLVELLVTKSFDTFCWMRDKGIRFIPIYGRQAFKIDGKFKFWGGLTVEAVGGGPGLIKMLTDAANKRGIDIRYQTRALSLLFDGVRVSGVRIRHDGVESDLHGKSVVLACGGFEANSEWRTRYLGPGWDLAKVRGTRFNTGDGIRMAIEIGAAPCGNWSGCHAVQWEMNAPEFGDLAVGDQFQKHSYPFCDPHQRQRQALRRRGRRLPQLHLCEIRPRGAGAARPVRLADLRREGQAPAARRVPHPAGHQGDRRHARGVRAEARGRERRAVPQDHRRVQRGGDATTSRSIPTSRMAGAPTGSRSTRATGRTRSTRRRSKAMR